MAAARTDITLALFGSLILERASTPVSGRATQRRRLALLSLLAGSPGQLLSRDRIIGLLWPEASASSARHLLTDAVYELRQALGDDAILSRGDDLALNPAVVTTDVAHFDAAIDHDDLERAVALYRGEFAHGLFVSGSSEFEHWLDLTRNRYRAAYRGALERSAEARAATQSSAQAAEAWHRLALDDVSDQRIALLAMNALAGEGRRGAALQLAAAHEQRMRELGAEPAVAVVELRAELSRQAGSRERGSQPATAPTAADVLGRNARWPRIAAAALLLATTMVLAATIRRRPAAADPNALVRVRLLASWPDRPSSGLARLAASGTTSTIALEEFLQGEHAWRRGRVLSAVEHFERATSADATFALGWYRLSQASIAADLPNMITRKADSLAFALASHTSPRERLLFKAYEYFRQGSGEGAEALYRTLLAQCPDCTEGWLQLGETLFHYNPPRGRPIAEAGPAFERALKLDPDNWIAQWHLALLAASRGDSAAHLRLLAQLATRDRVEPAQAAELLVLRRFAQRDYDADDLRRTVERLDELWLFRLTWVASVYQRDLEATEMLAAALASPHRPRHNRTLGLGVLQSVFLARGDWKGAARVATEMSGTVTSPLFEVDAQVAAALAPVPGWSRAAVVSARDRTLRWQAPPHEELVRQFWLGLLHAELGDSVGANAAAEQVVQGGGDAALIRALIALRAGHADEAVALLQRPAPQLWFGLAATSSWGARSMERYVRAQALAALGRDAEAEGWFRTLDEHVLGDLPYTGLALRARAQLAERRGESAEAVRLYRRLMQLWSGDHPALAALRDTLRRRADQLEGGLPAMR